MFTRIKNCSLGDSICKMRMLGGHTGSSCEAFWSLCNNGGWSITMFFFRTQNCVVFPICVSLSLKLLCRIPNLFETRYNVVQTNVDCASGAIFTAANWSVIDCHVVMHLLVYYMLKYGISMPLLEFSTH